MKIARISVVLTIFSILFGQSGRLPFFPENFNVYLQDVSVFFFLIFSWFYFSLQRRLSHLFPRQFFRGFIFISWALISFLFNSQWYGIDQNLLGFSYLLRFLLYFLFYLFLDRFYGEKERRGSAHFLFPLLILSGVLVALLGFVQLIVLPDLAPLALSGYDPHKNRLVSTFLDPNFTGAYLVLSLNLWLSVSRRPSLKGVVVALILLTGLLLTFSRSAWLTFGLSLFLFGLLKTKKLLVFGLLLGILSYLLVPRVQTRISGLTDPDDSARRRIVSWQRAWSVAEDNLLFGVGFNNYRSAQESYGFFDYRHPAGGKAGAGSDSSLLLVLSTTGIIGLVLYLLFYLHFIVHSWRRYRKGSSAALGVFISLLALLFDSFFVNSLFFSPIMLWLYVSFVFIDSSPRVEPKTFSRS